MIRPDAHLRKLIAEASPEQNARAMCKAREYYQMCKRLGIEPAELPRVLKEALEMEMAGIYRALDAADVGKARDDYFTRRQYGRNYTEP